MLNESRGYRRTIASCFVGYVAQACVCNFAPLLYVRFQSEFSLNLQQVSALITLTFAIQLLMDYLCSSLVDRIGYRSCLVAAHVFCALGFVLMAVLPDLLPSPYVGLVLSVVVYALGAGIIEVIISPLVEACPTRRKAAMMNLLHSFYAWGQMAVILLSTGFFALFGLQNWRLLALIWAIIPAVNGILFLKAPIPPMSAADGVPGLRRRDLIRSRMFWLLFLLMLCAGACELAVAQWASALVETELGVSKTIGDLAGPCLFGLCMGLGRTLGTRVEDNSIEALLGLCGIGCFVSYLLIALSPWPVLSLIGCGLCGLSVSVMWPSALSFATQNVRGGGTAMFALLALAGDVGCTTGPTWAGFCAGVFGDDLKLGILLSVLFPVLLLLMLQLIRSERRRLARR